MSSKQITRGDVLKIWNQGVTRADEIQKLLAQDGKPNIKLNTIYSHLRRLRQSGKIVRSDTGYSDQVVVRHNGKITADAIVDALLNKINRTLDMEDELEKVKQENWTLKNKLAATENELTIAKEELQPKVIAAERINHIAARLAKEQQKLSEEAQK